MRVCLFYNQNPERTVLLNRFETGFPEKLAFASASALLWWTPPQRCTTVIAPTGAGKTLAGFLPSLIELENMHGNGLHTLYISPLKALAADIKRN